MSALAIWRHNEFLSHRYDLGNMVQAVWNSAHGRLLEVTDGATGEQVVRLAGHVDPILVLFVPLWWLNPAPETLILVQAAALATGLYPVVRLALKYVGAPVAAVLLGGWYLVFPWLLWSAVNDVHPVTLAIPLLLWAIWFLDEQRLISFAIVAALAMATGELVGLTVAMLGVWYAFRYRRMRAGLCIAVAGTTWTALCLFVLIPVLRDGESSPFYARFETVGGSPTGVIHRFLAEPTAVLAAISTRADFEYAALILLPTAVLALLEPLMLAVALPQLATNTLADWLPATEPEYQYIAPILPPVLAASIMALRRVPERARVIAAAAPLGAALIALGHSPPVPGGHAWVFGSREPAPRRAAAARALSLIPPTASVTSTNRLGAHLSARQRVLQFPDRGASDWVALDTFDTFVVDEGERSDAALFRGFVEDLNRDPGWQLVFDREGIRVYRKRPPAPN